MLIKEVRLRLGVIGYGSMGSSFAKGLKDSAEEIIIYEINEEKRIKAMEEGFGVAKNIKFLVSGSDFILLAVKPKDAKDVLYEIKDMMDGKVLVSIVAGLNVEEIQKVVGKRKVIRTMPNINVIVQKGTMAYVCSQEVDEEEREKFIKTFSSCGSLYQIDEALMDSFTALVGSGPAFVFKFVSALILAGIREGFSYELARDMVLSLLLGSCVTLKNSDKHPEDWIVRVASPAGTTIEGIKVLEERGFSGTIIECISAATKRAKKLT
ncbi:MAG: pyrroline-5-carboxylate reductase [Aquificaceae bacterium]